VRVCENRSTCIGKRISESDVRLCPKRETRREIHGYAIRTGDGDGLFLERMHIGDLIHNGDQYMQTLEDHQVQKQTARYPRLRHVIPMCEQR